LLAYFASSLPNINTLKLYFYTPAPVLPCRCGQFGADACLCVPMRVDACRCAPMRADAVDAVISHTGRNMSVCPSLTLRYCVIPAKYGLSS